MAEDIYTILGDVTFKSAAYVWSLVIDASPR